MSLISILKTKRKQNDQKITRIKEWFTPQAFTLFKEKGLSPITRSLQTFEVGDTVNVVIDPSYQKGQPHHRFHGLTGKVTGNQGKACQHV